MDVQPLKSAWALLDALTPLQTDCGLCCGAACCAPDEDGQGGVYLFPGEERWIGPARWARVEPVAALGGAKVLTCDGRCERARRPLGCRIFPLTPKRMRDGSLGVRMDRRAFAMCPLAPSGVKGLNPAFVAAVREALNLVWSDPGGRRFLELWMALEARYGEGL